MLRILRRRKKIFLSSTTRDLAGWRKEIASVLQKNGLQPVVMEAFPAMNRSPKGGSVEMVRRCDAFIGLYARRYGTIGSDGVAIIENEFDAARDAGLPCMCFFLSADADWPEELTESGKAHQGLALFREKIQQNLIAQYFTDLPDLKLKVERSLDEYKGKELLRRRIALTALAAAMVLALTAFVAVGAEPDLVQGNTIAVEEGKELTSLAATQTSFITGDRDGDVWLWEKGRQARRFSYKNPSSVKDIALSEDGKTVSALLLGNQSSPAGIIVWDLESGNELWEYRSDSYVFHSVALRGSGGGLAVGVDTPSAAIYLFDGKGEVRNIFRIEELKGVEADLGRVMSLSFSADGGTLAAGLQNGFVLIDIDQKEGSLILSKSESDDRIFTIFPGLAFQNSSVAIASQFQNGVDTHNRIWIYDSGQGIRKVGDMPDVISKLVRLGSGNLVLATSLTGDVVVWDTVRGERVQSTKLLETAGLEDDRYHIYDASYSSKTRAIFVMTPSRIFEWRLEWTSFGGIPLPGFAEIFY